MDIFKRVSETLFDSTIGLLQAWQKRSVQIVKIEAAKYYLQTIQEVRRQSILLASGLFCLFVLAVAVVAMPVVLLLLLPLSVAAKLKIACVLIVLDLGIPVLYLWNFFSQKNWMRFTRSGEFIANAVRED
ncbi:MAG: hypothetical protein A3C47_02930 [Omnitrophica bacterium RIFCSPHIGHO2_02_FULL_51_18]|nr:MAG: hypothetical protein A3C47_02930 [Omnitrophica bacterium RIFCSPHIGHO2_02_FULL_51_18]